MGGPRSYKPQTGVRFPSLRQIERADFDSVLVSHTKDATFESSPPEAIPE
jgi:hypothetical protein